MAKHRLEVEHPRPDQITVEEIAERIVSDTETKMFKGYAD
jgi:hypothetical protein